MFESPDVQGEVTAKRPALNLSDDIDNVHAAICSACAPTTAQNSCNVRAVALRSLWRQPSRAVAAVLMRLRASTGVAHVRHPGPENGCDRLISIAA